MTSTAAGASRWWAICFLTPFAVVFLGLAVLPLAYELMIGASLDNYRRLLENPVYSRAVANTALFVVVAVNVKMLLALGVSGLLVAKRRWIRWTATVSLIPWMIPEVVSMLSARWMLNSTSGVLNRALESVGLSGASWLDRPWLAMASAIGVHVWKLTPFWALTLLAARLAVPTSVYEAAAMDGAGTVRTFRHVTWPLIAGVYLAGTLLASIWAIGDFNSVYLLTGGGPADSTQVLATLGVQYAFRGGSPEMGASVVMTALPVLFIAVVFLVRRSRRHGAIL